MSSRSEPKRLVGYVDRFSVRAGESLDIHVGSDIPYRLTGVRLRAADTLDGGFAAVAEQVPWAPSLDGVPSSLALPMGSHVVVDDHPALQLEAGGSILVWICPTMPTRPQIVLGKGDTDEAGYWLGLDGSGVPSLVVSTNGRLPLIVSTSVALRRWTWYLLAVGFDPTAGRVTMVQIPANHRRFDPTLVMTSETIDAFGVVSTTDPLLIAARRDRRGAAVGHFDGRIEAPTISSRALDLPSYLSLAASWDVAKVPGVLAAWDMSQAISTDRVVDVGPHGLHGRTENQPTRAVAGHNWSGSSLDWTEDPTSYGAIHFHSDDLEDAKWKVAATIHVPDSAESGIYAIDLRGDGVLDRVPFIVRPSAERTADLLWLLPSNTYLAYGNQHGEDWAAIASRGWPQGLPTPYPTPPETRFAIEHRLLSLYDRHADGSGVSLGSWHRPIANLRPDVNEEPSPDGRGFPHGFAADLQVAGWLRRQGLRADVAADEDLDADGIRLLSKYRVLMTGTHPEYWTERMLDAVTGYIDAGGRIVYLGGNGFFWVTSFHSLRRHVIEVRRWGGSRPWTARPGEYHHATTGELGGLWRERGRFPQRLVGVGFTAQGSGPARPFERTAGSFDPRVAWIFEGVSDAGIIGDIGVVMGGAAGLEFDRADADLGTPPHALVIASASGFSDAYQAAVEDVEISDSRQGGTVASTVRADMVYFETPNDGAVFSAGSIAFGGAVVANGGDNAASRVLENVLRAFMSEKHLPPSGIHSG